MAYGLKYRADYDTLNGDTCRIEIFEKDYSGIVYPLELSGEPVTQSYQTDEAAPEIKGCSLTMRFLNSGSLSIKSFCSNEDDTYKAVHYKNGNVTFVGYLVQDDYSEPLADYRHEIELSANDNLGLLKDVPLNNENIDTFYAFESATFETVAPHTVKISNINYAPTTDRFYITQVGFAGIYNATAVSYSAGVYTVTVSETVSSNSPVSGFYGYKKVIDYYGRNNLLSIIQACLFNTGLQLFTEVYCNVYEESFKTDICPLQQTYIDTKTFYENDNFKSSWDTLIYILNRFKLTLFQSGGKWIIVRWKELRYGNVTGFQFDEYFNLIQNVVFSASVDIGFNEAVYPEAEPVKTIIRPYKSAKETFNYQQPKYLLRNSDLQSTGSLLNSYTTGSGDDLKNIYEYVALYWSNGPFSPFPSIFIRVIKDNEDNEIERYLVIKGNTGDNPRSAVGVPFEVNEGDKITFDYNFKSNISEPGNINLQLAVMVTDGTNTYFADESGTWGSTSRWLFNIPSGDNLNQPHNADIKPGRIPISGLLYCYLPQVCPTPLSSTDETQIKDIVLTYTPYINESTKITGHTHKTEQAANIKNVADEVIYIDDSPRNSIAGTLFKSSYDGVLMKKTNRWYRLTNSSERLKLGDIITGEELQQANTIREKIEGTFYGLDGVTMFTKITYSPFNTLLFIFGSMEINFRSNSFDATLYEVAAPGESDTGEYEFKYLYATK